MIFRPKNTPALLSCLAIIGLSSVLLRSRQSISEELSDSPIPPSAARQMSLSDDRALVALGRMLFFDPRLSVGNTVSCSTCHQPDHGWTSPEPLTRGVGNQLGKRHVPTLYNTGLRKSFFWDGRATTLEEQVLQPIEDPHEMAMPLDSLLERLAQLGDYQDAIVATRRDLNRELLASSLAAFCETIVAEDAPFDRYRAGDVEALSPSARRGHDLFFFGLNCATCHTGSQLTDEKFHNIGVGMDADEPDLGRYEVTKRDKDRGAFRTPSLRNISETAPYMHDGRFETLEEVIDFYIGGGVANPHLDPMINVLPLDEDQKSDLVQFLKEGLKSPHDPAAERSKKHWANSPQD